MQRDLTNNDNDWQLKKLQHDSLKTSEKVFEVLRETIEKEVLAHAKDYERLFGSRSAQFAEYLTMVAQKLEQHGIQHSDVIDWLTSTATEGSVPRDYASDLRDSQSKTVPFIPGGPMHDFGEQSLMDKSLGNYNNNNSNNNQLAAPPAPVPQAPPVQPVAPAAQVHPPQPAPGLAQVQIPRPTQPIGGAQPFGQPQFAQPQFPQPQFGQAGPQPFAPAQQQQQQQPQPQPNFGAPQMPPQQAPQPAQSNLAVTTSQPLPPVSAPAFDGKKKDEDKYVFDPFTAWD